jgi:hypothetical protein
VLPDDEDVPVVPPTFAPESERTGPEAVGGVVGAFPPAVDPEFPVPGPAFPVPVLPDGTVPGAELADPVPEPETPGTPLTPREAGDVQTLEAVVPVPGDGVGATATATGPLDPAAGEPAETGVASGTETQVQSAGQSASVVQALCLSWQ